MAIIAAVVVVAGREAGALHAGGRERGLSPVGSEGAWSVA